MMEDIKLRKKLTDNFYMQKPQAPIALEEFGFYSLEEWERQGYIKKDEDLGQLFGFKRLLLHYLPGMSGTTAPFYPRFKEEIVNQDESYDIVRDKFGRLVKYFKGRREGFMPQYLDFPVKDMKTWEEVKLRLDYKDLERNENLKKSLEIAKEKSNLGFHTISYIVGPFMYLRSLMGCEQLLYTFYDNPKLIHEALKTWLELAIHVISFYQKEIIIDELLFDEDICYNHGSLISPDQIREFLFPYYKPLIASVRKGRWKLEEKRLKTSAYNLIIHMASDGDIRPVIPVYQEIGANYMSPMEVASGIDVVEIRKSYPDLLIKGGFDKRILASSKEAIKKEVDRIMPFMVKYGGYLPTCDHGVPPEVPFENYIYFRKLLEDYSV